MSFKSGFVAVLGRPNVGKSTLINKIIGQKINIISQKPQTTRSKMKTILTEEQGQIIFTDTPGIHSPKNELDEYMLQEAYSSLDGIDLIIFLVDACSPYGSGDNFIYKQIQSQDQKILMVMNKIDKVNNKVLIKRKKEYERKTDIEVIPVSARTGKNIDFLVDKMFALLPEGPKYYPEDMITDQIERYLAAEIVREKIFNYTRDEIPYGTAVLTEEFKERKNGVIYIRANIHVEEKSHKGIIICKNGKMLKKIGREARRDIEKLLQEKVYLDLWVKIQQNWRKDEQLLERLGYKKDD